MTTTTDVSGSGQEEPPTTVDHQDRATRTATAHRMTAEAAATWLTAETVAAIGPAVAASIRRFRSTAGHEPTWAEALDGIDPDLLTPLAVVPPGWPLAPAVWRRDLRTRLMERLKHTAWVTYTTKPRSLQTGSRGRAASQLQ